MGKIGMKAILPVVVIVLILLLTINLCADDWKFKTLQYSYVVLDYADLFTTWKTLEIPNLREANPFAGWYFKRPLIGAVITFGANLAIYQLGKLLYKKSKTLAYIVVSTLVVFKTYAVIHNYRIANK